MSAATETTSESSASFSESPIASTSTSTSISTTATDSQPPSPYPQQPSSAGHSRGIYPMSADMIQIANFRPTPRQVINGIAPHVFDERRRRRSQKRVPRPAYWYGQHGEKRSSPLRGATAISWEEHAIYLEQTDTRGTLVDSDSEKVVTSVVSLTPNTGVEDQKSISQSPTPNLVTKSRWRSLRIDKRLLKNLRMKLLISSFSKTP
ncbi:hypothetical protein CPB83DRAFT_856813 [Crepidotus variabilis]|uniref:Uncharacterized protein n=1 Tax=Crepidotus variabilis TaxID=179855 RepID=A0A9P6EDS9_9AGAR|nr:hypothetical protein CPB83DRAFT_856813 [Crepidotus variabilis]